MNNKDKLVEYWLKASDLDFEASENLMKSEKYPHALFFAHLCLEKILKALYIKINDKYPPRTHNLLVLAKNTLDDFYKNMEKELIVINSFNIEARYPDEKFEFYQKCTADFTQTQFSKIKEMRSWLKTKF